MAPPMTSFFGNTAPSPGLPMAHNAMVLLVQYQGNDWFMDTGTSGHTTNNPSIVSSTCPTSFTSHIIIGNSAPLPI
jgi:hypothetical protein